MLHSPPWSSLEAIDGQCAVTAIWREYLGPAYDSFAPAYLQAVPETVLSFPCPRDCGCWHRVEPAPDGTFIAHCRCRHPTCAALTLTRLDVTPFELKLHKLARELCRALGINSKPSDFPFSNTIQIGSWSADLVPALFTIQTEVADLRALISEAAVRFQKPYILLAPTASSLDGQSQQLLASAKAAFFALNTTVTLAPDGAIQSIKGPDALFSQVATEAKMKSGKTQKSSNPSSPLPAPAAAQAYALHLHKRIWHLWFASLPSFLDDEHAVRYLAWLLTHPLISIHGYKLYMMCNPLTPGDNGPNQLPNPYTGEFEVLPNTPILQEASSALDLRPELTPQLKNLLAEIADLKTTTENQAASQLERDEAAADLKQKRKVLSALSSRAKDGAEKAVKTVRRALTRFYDQLKNALDENGNPHPTLRAFAKHIYDQIILPSRATPSHLVYHPLPGISWNP